MSAGKTNTTVSPLAKRLLILALVVAVAAVIKTLGLDQYLTLSYLKHSRQALLDLYHAHPFLFTAGYFITYVVVTALSIPGAVVMTLAGGAILGLVTGTIVISFASTIGATLAFLLARFLLRQWVESRFGDKIQVVNKGIEEEGAFYLFTLRLIPAFPFFVINVVMGLTRMGTGTYFLVSQIGMLPGTIVYVNAGAELAKIESVSGILSPRLIGAFALLGILPLAARKAVDFYKKKKKKKRSG